ncbi:MAG: zinc-binding alcohol dehydrogenase family protein [Alphaproteobacteria bacterium]|nr:zinc-binding alcohol dehydrogenase family protein [Alphaproteobacteria bacterium]
MQGMVLHRAHEPLRLEARPVPEPARGELLVRVSVGAVCRTDLHVVDGELPQAVHPIIPGHEIVGRVEKCGANVTAFAVGERVGVPWLGGSCGTCEFCRTGRENLCDTPAFTGCTRDGGFATHVLADARFAFRVPQQMSDKDVAPLLCAGLIGWRTLKTAGDAPVLGIFGFGAAAHLIAQVAVAQGRSIYAFTRDGDAKAQELARELGCAWAGSSNDEPPAPLDAAIIFAPVGALVPRALALVKKGGRVVCGGIHMSDIPSFPYALLWGERQVCSVANLTRADAVEFLDLAGKVALQVRTTEYPLSRANDALDDLRAGRLSGAAVLRP